MNLQERINNRVERFGVGDIVEFDKDGFEMEGEILKANNPVFGQAQVNAYGQILTVNLSCISLLKKYEDPTDRVEDEISLEYDIPSEEF
jgi:hypothetical protein